MIRLHSGRRNAQARCNRQIEICASPEQPPCTRRGGPHLRDPGTAEVDREPLVRYEAARDN